MNDRATRIANLPLEQRRIVESMLQERAQAHVDKSIPALPRRSESGGAAAFPLLPRQRLAWIGEQRMPGSVRHSPISLAMRLRGPLDEAALEAGLHQLCARHEALHTTFEAREEDGEPVQIVGPPHPVPLARVDLRKLPPTARQEEVRRLIYEEVQKNFFEFFDLSRDLMLWATLLQLDDEEHVLLLVMHHIVSDGLSVGVLLRDLWALYEAMQSGRPANLPELPVQFADYVVWQRQRLQGGTLQRQTEYWKKQLAGARAVVAIPTDSQSVSTQWSSYWQARPVPAWLEEELHALCRQQNFTLYMLLLAAWATLLHRYSGQDDILMLTPFANRNRAEVGELIGYFANVLPLRTDLAGDPSFAELLGRVRETVVHAFSNSEVPMAELIELHPQLNTQYWISFQLENRRFNLKLNSLQVERIEIDEGGNSPTLSMFVIEGNDGLKARLDYSSAFFEHATITRMLEDFMSLLESIVADPERRISSLLPAASLQSRAGG